MTEPTIPSNQYAALLQAFSVGNPVAENDWLLQEARLETSVLSQIMADEIDIVKGTKGSGKTAIYRVCTDFLFDYILSQKNVVTLKGIEVSGDPIFSSFQKQFEQMNELAFQNFWRVYIISLINTHFIDNPRFSGILKGAKKELSEYRAAARRNGFPVAENLLTWYGLVNFVFAKLPASAKVSAGMRPDGGLEGALEVKRDTAPQQVDEANTPVFVNELTRCLIAVLNKCNLDLWVMLDRLDEVFPRRSPLETIALRALLRTTSSFNTRVLRLKVFLRDDIFEDITEKEGFTALSHVTSRCSGTMSWSKPQILHLIVSRVCAHDRISNHFKVDKVRLGKDEKYRAQIFNKIFPERIRPGRNQSLTIDWLYKHCEDARSVVTPRDIIDLLTFAKAHQVNLVASHAVVTDTVISGGALMAGHKEMAQKKRETFLKAEFRHLWDLVEKLENGRSEYTERAMLRIFGTEWQHRFKDLRSIGVLKHNPRTKTYQIPFLYRQCLGVKQGKELK